jgi:hypothetical protein
MPQVLSRLILKAFEWAEKSPEDSESMLCFLLNSVSSSWLTTFPNFPVELCAEKLWPIGLHLTFSKELCKFKRFGVKRLLIQDSNKRRAEKIIYQPHNFRPTLMSCLWPLNLKRGTVRFRVLCVRVLRFYLCGLPGCSNKFPVG